MPQPRHFDLVVIGGGPGGYVGAIRAAQLGMRVACVERAKLGGVCLNWGCIPSKALLSHAELVEKLAHAAEWGLRLPGRVELDWDRIIGRSREVAGKLNRGIAYLFRKNRVEHIAAHARIVSGRRGDQPCTVVIHECQVHDEITPAPARIGEALETITADHVLIATGSVARDLPMARFDGQRIWGAREAMFNRERPGRLVVVGAGAIGMEFAYFYHAMGTQVTVVEMLDRVLPAEDHEISDALLKIYRKAGLDIRLGSTVVGVDKTEAGVTVRVAPLAEGTPVESKAETLQADRLLLAIGVQGRTDGLCEESLGLALERGHVVTDYRAQTTRAEALDYATSVPGVYAIGDVIGPPWLAHVASDEAITCVERIAWKAGKLAHEPIPIDYSVIPACTYCQPQVASVGYTEQRLQAMGMVRGKDYEVGRHSFQAHGKAIAAGHTEGLVKVIRALPRGEILGAHILGDQATELIAELTLARRLEATTEELIVTTHAHPTMHEAVREAALAAEGRAIHA